MIWNDIFLYTHQLILAYSAITVTTLKKRRDFLCEVRKPASPVASVEEALR